MHMCCCSMHVTERESFVMPFHKLVERKKKKKVQHNIPGLTFLMVLVQKWWSCIFYPSWWWLHIYPATYAILRLQLWQNSPKNKDNVSMKSKRSVAHKEKEMITTHACEPTTLKLEQLQPKQKKQRARHTEPPASQCDKAHLLVKP